ncbi:hypothetical protein PGS49_22080 [Yersinia intermedia]|uniref:hypothetical protein n=1 Tax=Yersinia intermedia TaxID=631 RepID=UPI001C94A1CF|nr:hypothetical protein [Yersinia intermedia]MCW8111946.1 hypothetical protein [Yersinia intermedia]MDA5483299.1 hypothetical protein [Yersinia intermedia]MDA5518856.1 hypothetical protein [Yersinia intermedia]
MMKLHFLSAIIGLLAFSALASDALVKETTLGRVYTDTKGMTLYTFDNDKQDLSTCYQDCAKAWPPLLKTMPLNSLDWIKLNVRTVASNGH